MKLVWSWNLIFVLLQFGSRIDMSQMCRRPMLELLSCSSTSALCFGETHLTSLYLLACLYLSIWDRSSHPICSGEKHPMALCLSPSLSHTHTLSLSHTHTHAASLSLSLSLIFSLFLSLSLSLSLSFSLPLCFSLCLSALLPFRNMSFCKPTSRDNLAYRARL